MRRCQVLQCLRKNPTAPARDRLGSDAQKTSDLMCASHTIICFRLLPARDGRVTPNGLKRHLSRGANDFLMVAYHSHRRGKAHDDEIRRARPVNVERMTSSLSLLKMLQPDCFSLIALRRVVHSRLSSQQIYYPPSTCCPSYPLLSFRIYFSTHLHFQSPSILLAARLHYDKICMSRNQN